MEELTTFHLRGQLASRQVWLNGEELTAEKSLAIVNHSPTGFAWGYGGSGPAQLALAICLELFPQPLAVEIYKTFKWQIVSTLPKGDFEKKIDLFDFLADNQACFVELRKHAEQEKAWKEEDRIVIAEMAEKAAEEGYRCEPITLGDSIRYQFYDSDGYKAFWYQTKGKEWIDWSF